MAPAPLGTGGGAGLAKLLAARGISLARLPGESFGDHGDRIDTELMALYRDTGQDDAFEALYRHAGVRLFPWLRGLVRARRSDLDPVELLQDTFVNVYRYSHAFRDGHRGGFHPWARKIALNALRRAALPQLRTPMRHLAEGPGEPVDPGLGPALRMAADEEREALRLAWLLFLLHYSRAFASLSPRDRRALELVEIHGVSYARASELLGVGPSNMKMIMLRARRRLQERMRGAMLPERRARLEECARSTGPARGA
jgi:RNA polymerase sigma factor (sigma-70 family)